MDLFNDLEKEFYIDVANEAESDQEEFSKYRARDHTGAENIEFLKKRIRTTKGWFERDQEYAEKEYNKVMKELQKKKTFAGWLTAIGLLALLAITPVAGGIFTGLSLGGGMSLADTEKELKKILNQRTSRNNDAIKKLNDLLYRF